MLFAGANAFAVTATASGAVTSIYTYGDGSVLVTGINFPTGTCSHNSGVYIEGANPALSRLLATILTAKASGLSISVNAKVDGCWYPTITADSTTYIILGS
jgi:hypothetical protein